jgi:hypothetical protein
MLAALASRQRLGFSCGDAAILEAACAIRGQTVLSDDVPDDADYAGVIVARPVSRLDRRNRAIGRGAARVSESSRTARRCLPGYLSSIR